MLEIDRPAGELKRLAVCVAALCEAFNRKPTKATYLAYEIGLEGIEIGDVESACAKALRTPSTFMPSPGELRELAGDSKVEDRAIWAFQALSEACARYGSARSPDFDDPLINAVVRNLGGWEKACHTPESEFDVWYRKRFEQIYEVFSRTGVSQDMITPLVGTSEAANRANGFPNDRCLVHVRTGLPWAGKPVKLLSGPGPESRPQLRIVGPSHGGEA